MFNDKWFIFAVAAALFLGLCILFSGGVYTTVSPVEEVGFYRVNRFTGETWLARRLVARKVEYESEDDVPPPPPPAAPKKPFVDDLSPGVPKATEK